MMLRFAMHLPNKKIRNQQAVIIDENRFVIAVKCHYEVASYAQEVTEALACCMGIQMATDLQIHKIQIEADCQALIQKLSNSEGYIHQSFDFPFIDSSIF